MPKRASFGLIFSAAFSADRSIPSGRPLTIRATGPASTAAAAAATAARPALPKIGRNDPCWCGSGKKYKQCHMRLDREHLDGKGSAPNKKDVSLV